MLALSAFRNDLDESSVPRLGKAALLLSCWQEGIIQPREWCLAPGIMSQGPPCSGKPMVALSADILLWLPMKMRWDKPDKRCPCSVVGALMITASSTVVAHTEQGVSCASISVCLWIECSVSFTRWARVTLFPWPLFEPVAEAAFHCPQCT